MKTYRNEIKSHKMHNITALSWEFVTDKKYFKKTYIVIYVNQSVKTFPVLFFFFKSRRLARNEKVLRDVFVWSKLDILEHSKAFMIKRYNALEAIQVTDISLMVTTQSDELSLLIGTRYWKKLVLGTWNWGSSNTIKKS